MDARLKDLREGRGGNYLLPFFWQHGEEEAVLREEMRRIRESGIGAVCVEARPHPDFAGPGWWRDMDIVLDEARTHGMKVWLLDDAHFPTGFANGWIRDRYPEKGRIFLQQKTFEASGPAVGMTYRVGDFLNAFDWMHPEEKLYGDDRIHAVVALRTDGEGALDLTAQVADGLLRWDVPAGNWRVSVLFVTRSGGGRADYVNLIDADSVQVLIDAVHEPHYARYGADFGTTFLGFFSDEPCFGNTKGYQFDEILGKKRMVLPWSDELGRLLAERLGPDAATRLPGLWEDVGAATPAVRFAYMDLVTMLYARNFARKVGDWCSAHGVTYIGHVIEDMNVHARLGAGAGHFFRALSGQHWAGVDLIGQQVLPRLVDFRGAMPGLMQDSEFFHFALCKLGSSAGHIDPKKRGVAMCEIWGASGWATGLRTMKWVADHALVRGINRFVPHAFSPKEFPDPDCPPHFFARGHNPQYRHFRILMDYLNRLSHLLDGGLHVCDAAVLYHAEAEWAGEAQPLQKAAHRLARAQVDFDVLPADVLCGDDAGAAGTRVDAAELHVNGETYRALVVPYAQRLPSALLAWLADAHRAGLRVAFSDARPEGVSDAADPTAPAAVALLAGIAGIPAVPLDALAGTLRAQGVGEVSAAPAAPDLRHYHYRRAGSDLYFFMNEHPTETVATTVTVPQTGPVRRYDAFADRLVPQAAAPAPGGAGTALGLRLAPYESAVVLFDGEAAPADALSAAASADAIASAAALDAAAVPVAGPWTVARATAERYPAFGEETALPDLVDLGGPGLWPDFSGAFRYRTSFRAPSALGSPDEPAPSRVVLDLGRVVETAEIRVNGRPAGVRIVPPYRFDVTDLLAPGENVLEVEVTTTLARQQKDFFSLTMGLEPSGLLGPVALERTP